MTPEEKQMMDEVFDLAKYASVEAAKRITRIADVMPEDQFKIMVGLRASRSLFTSYLLTAVQNGMPVCGAVRFLCDTMEQIGEMIVELTEKQKED